MKIVQVEDFFHPDAGYQVNILSKYFVSFGHEVTIITAMMDIIPETLTAFFGANDIEKKDKDYSEKYNVKIIRLQAKKYISGRVIFDTKKLVQTINQEQPDIIFAHGNDTFTSIQIIRHHNYFNCPIVSDSHMVSIASENRFRNLFRKAYRRLVTPIIRREEIPVIRTADDPYVRDAFNIPLEQAPLISFGSDTLLFHPDEHIKSQKRKELDISEDTFVIVYAGKLDESKGGRLLAELTCKEIIWNRKVQFVVVGNTVENDYGKEVEALFEDSKTTLRFPTQKYQDLAQFYQLADLAIIPRQCSLSIYDMQACGLPVLAEDNSINKQRLSYGNGWVFKSGDLNDMAHKLQEITEMPDDDFKAVSKNANNNIIDNYDYSERAKEYEKVLLKVYENYQTEKK